MKKVVKKLTVVFGAVLIFGGAIFGYRYFSGKKEPAYDFVVVKRDTLIQEVSVTGRVKPTESVDLAFESGGKVAGINVKIGDKAIKDQILAELDNAGMMAQVRQAEAGLENAKAQLTQYQATLENEQAKLLELNRGTRKEEVKLAETKVANAEKALIDAKDNLTKATTKAESELNKAKQSVSDYEKNLDNIKSKAEIDLANIYNDIEDILNDGYAKAHDAVNTKTAGMFNGNVLTFYTSDSLAKANAESRRPGAVSAVNDFSAALKNIAKDYPGLDQNLIKAENWLLTSANFLLPLIDAVNLETNLSAATKETYQGNLYTARNNINTEIDDIDDKQASITAQKQTNQNNIDSAEAALNTAKAALNLQDATNQSNISTAEAQVTTAENNLESAKDELALKKAGSAPEQISGQEAKVRQARANITSQQAKIKEAQANLEDCQTQLTKAMIKAPFDGVIIRQEAKAGEIVGANINLIALISERQYEIEVFIPEADIAKVKIGNLAQVTLDAYGNEIFFEAKAKSIEPAETIIEGVPTYKTILEFTAPDERIKSGMTANIDVSTEKRENAIVIPGRAVISRNGDKIVRLLDAKGKAYQEVKVAVGLRSSDGRVEILSGINEGDKVITFAEEK